MLRWSTRAKAAIRKLFEPLQDIDIYIEDTNDEAFYRTLLNTIIQGKVQIVRVFSLGGRKAVIDAAKTHDHSRRRALFIIDGDLEWVCGDQPPEIVGLHQHDAYCIENILICEKALSQILSQEAILTEEDAANALGFRGWVKSIQEPLLKLFSAFATAKRFTPEEKTVSLGIGAIITQITKKQTVLDEIKVADVSSKALSAVEAKIGKQKAYATYREILARLRKLSTPLHAVSGKDFLLPLLDFRLQEFGCRIRRKSLRMRLATTGDLKRFAVLNEAIHIAALGHP